METKLTLRMDEKTIHRAKAYARKSGKSISRLVSDFFVLLGSKEERKASDMTPKVKSLRGVFRGSDFSIAKYRRHLEDKYL